VISQPTKTIKKYLKFPRARLTGAMKAQGAQVKTERSPEA
jgi:hypothetical protein